MGVLPYISNLVAGLDLDHVLHVAAEAQWHSVNALSQILANHKLNAHAPHNLHVNTMHTI